MAKQKCPNCGSTKLEGSLELPDGTEVIVDPETQEERVQELTRTIEPEGGILVCGKCHFAVAPEGSEEAEGQENAPEPDLTAPSA